MFSYYQKLSPTLKAVYRISDKVQAVPPLPDVQNLRVLSAALGDSLSSGDKAAVSASTQLLADALARSFAVQVPRVRVLNQRPLHSRSEYYGLYESSNDGSPPVIKVWMYTRQQRRVVAYKTFLRTFLHEFCHHLDYEWLCLADSLHTEGFFMRESSLFKQLTAVS